MIAIGVILLNPGHDPLAQDPAPRVEIVAPQTDSTVRGELGVVAVGHGFTDLAIFGRATFELAPGNGDFSLLAEDTNGSDGFASLWDTRDVPNGTYRLRATVTAVDHMASAEIAVQVDNRPGLRFSRSDMRFVEETDARLPDIVNVNYGIDVGDVDRDGDADLWVADCGREGDQLLLNDGDGRFDDVTEERLARPDASGHWRRTSFGEDVVFADVDGDDDLDAYVNSDLSNRVSADVEPEALFINDGTGRFVDEIEDRLPMDVIRRQGTSDLAAFGDLDGDGDLDLVRITRAPIEASPIEQNGRTGLFLNDGTGVFTDATDRLPDDAGSFSEWFGLADVDQDGDEDVVLSNLQVEHGPTTRNEVRIYRNDGNSRFEDASSQLLPPEWMERSLGKFTLDDIDNDGDDDIVASHAILRYDQRSGRFVADGDAPFARGAGLAITGDVNNDGYPDLITTEARAVGGHGTHHPVLLLNDRRGHFRSPRVLHDMPTETVIQDMGLVDADGDGDRDLYVGTGVPPHDHPGQEGMVGGEQKDRLLINTLIHPSSETAN